MDSDSPADIDECQSPLQGVGEEEPEQERQIRALPNDAGPGSSTSGNGPHRQSSARPPPPASGGLPTDHYDDIEQLEASPLARAAAATQGGARPEIDRATSEELTLSQASNSEGSASSATRSANSENSLPVQQGTIGNFASKEEVRAYSVRQLRSILAFNKLPVRGSKTDLLQR